MSAITTPTPLKVQRLKRFASRARTLAAVYFIVLFTATHIPVDPSQVVDVSDKILHFTGYAALTILVLIGWEFSNGALEPKHFFAVWLAGTIYGVFDETTQTYVGRTCDMNDWAADVAGIVTGLIVFAIARALLYRIAAWMEAYDARK
jgi:VanZ family protein